MAKIKTYSVPVALQKFIISLVALHFVIGNAATLYQVVDQYPRNPNLSGFWVSFLALGLVPVLLFAIVAAISPNRGNRLSRVFEAALLTIVGVLLYQLLTGLFYALNNASPSIGRALQPLLSFGIMVDVTIALVATAVFGVVLYYFRRTGRWQ